MDNFWSLVSIGSSIRHRIQSPLFIPQISIWMQQFLHLDRSGCFVQVEFFGGVVTAFWSLLYVNALLNPPKSCVPQKNPVNLLTIYHICILGICPRNRLAPLSLSYPNTTACRSLFAFVLKCSAKDTPMNIVIDAVSVYPFVKCSDFLGRRMRTLEKPTD